MRQVLSTRMSLDVLLAALDGSSKDQLFEEVAQATSDAEFMLSG